MDCTPKAKEVTFLNLNMLFMNYTQDNEIFFMFDQLLSLYENPKKGNDLVVDVLAKYTQILRL